MTIFSPAVIKILADFAAIGNIIFGVEWSIMYIVYLGNFVSYDNINLENIFLLLMGEYFMVMGIFLLKGIIKSNCTYILCYLILSTPYMIAASVWFIYRQIKLLNIEENSYTLLHQGPKEVMLIAACVVGITAMLCAWFVQFAVYKFYQRQKLPTIFDNISISEYKRLYNDDQPLPHFV